MVNSSFTDEVQKFEVDFGGEKIVLPGHHIAFNHIVSLDRLYVGARVVTMFQEPERSWYDAGILVDLPNRNNKSRLACVFVFVCGIISS